MPTVNFDRLSIMPGESALITLPYSEVCMSMGVAGRTISVQLSLDGRMAQLYRNGRKFSAPITYGEAGIYRDGAGYYHY